MVKSFIQIKLLHEHGPSTPYRPNELEDALQNLNLPEIPWDSADQEGIMRHETGPEIIVLATSLISLASKIVTLVREWRNKRPQTKIQITVSSPDELREILNILKSKS